MSEHGSPWPRWLLAGLLLFVGLGGIYGGATLVADPTGAGLGVRLSDLEGSPFPTYLIPGLVLLTINGLGSTAAGIATLLRWRWSGHTGAAVGAFLVAWILVQVAVVGLDLTIPFQPVFFIIGVAELGLGYHVAGRLQA